MRERFLIDMDFFIDKLNVVQNHVSEGESPLVGREMVQRLDISTLKKRYGISPKKFEGSYSSSLNIRCDGENVSVEGNPSRYNRIENLFGFYSFDECISVYNSILDDFDLPFFTKCTEVYHLQDKNSEKVKMETNGAKFRHIDFTKNHMVGRDSETKFLKGLAGQSLGKGKDPYLYPNHKTVCWYKGSKLKYKKVYVKSTDLIDKKRERLKDASEIDREYYQKVIDYCVSNGVVREGHSFKRDFLARNNLNFYGLVEEKDFEKYLNDIGDVMKRFEIVDTKFETVADKLIRKGICNSYQSANATNSVFELWRQDNLIVGKNIKRSQYYEHKKRLKEIGYDISNPFDLATLPIPMVSSEVINIVKCEVPEWYRSPSHLRLVS